MRMWFSREQVSYINGIERERGERKPRDILDGKVRKARQEILTRDR